MLAATSPSPPNPDSPNTPVNVAEHAGLKIHNLELDAAPAAITQPEAEPVKDAALEAAAPDEAYDAPAPAVEGQTGLVDSTADDAVGDESEARRVEAEDVKMDEEVAEPGSREEEQDEQMMDAGTDDQAIEALEAEIAGEDEGVAYGDVTMDSGAGHSPPAGSSTTAVDSVVEDEQPPAKRARVDSDADVASTHTAAPNAASSAAVLSIAQHKHLLQTVRSLKKLKDATPFRIPVDAVALGIPHYYQVITHPMDLSTVERRLLSSNPAKPDTNPSNPRYATADEFTRDMRQIFINSLTFNGPDHAVTNMGKKLEESFDRALKALPPPEEEDRAAPSWLTRPSHSASAGPRPSKPAAIKREKVSSPPPAPTPKKSSVQRRPSTTTPTIRRNDDGHRPKREIHTPATKELPYINEPKKQQLSAPPRRRSSKSSSASNEQLKYCGKILDHLNRKQYYNTVVHFAEPVDWKALQIPDYPKIVKKPMDLRTMRQKLDHDEYASVERFRADFNQIIKNCRDYNAPGTLVFNAGQDLQRLFDDKWRGMPPLRPTVESEDDGENEYDDDEESERQRKIQEMQAQMQALQAQMQEMQQSPSVPAKKPKPVPAPAPSKKRKPPPVIEQTASAPLPSTSKVKKERAPPPPPPPPKKKAPSRKSIAIPDDDVLSFDQKKELSDAIGTLDGTKLERVINIIHEGVPEIRDSQEEIELEIDSLPAGVLTKLYNFVIRPMKPPPPKKPRTGKGTGTGGLKRKSMDEDVEEAKIRKLEAQMRLFDEHAAGGSTSGSAPLSAMPVLAAQDHESDSSSDDESSGSDTE